MGIAALNNAEGKYITMKLLLLTVFAAVALADESAEEGATPAVAPVAVYPHQLHWPGVYGIGLNGVGFSSQCFGCRGKRSAEAEPEAEASPFYGHPFGYHPLGYYGLPLVHVTPDLTLAGKTKELLHILMKEPHGHKDLLRVPMQDLHGEGEGDQLNPKPKPIPDFCTTHMPTIPFLCTTLLCL